MRSVNMDSPEQSDKSEGAESAAATETMLPCPNCGETDVDATFSLNGEGQVSAGCMVCCMTGPESNSARDAADRWNNLPRRTAVVPECGLSEETVRRAEATMRVLADDDASMKADKEFWRGRARFFAEQIIRAPRSASGFAQEAELQRRLYEAVADAVNDVATEAHTAFVKAGLENIGDWDGDNIVQDVKRGIVSAIEQLAARSTRGALPWSKIDAIGYEQKKRWVTIQFKTHHEALEFYSITNKAWNESTFSAIGKR